MCIGQFLSNKKTNNGSFISNNFGGVAPPELHEYMQPEERDQLPGPGSQQVSARSPKVGTQKWRGLGTVTKAAALTEKKIRGGK